MMNLAVCLLVLSPFLPGPAIGLSNFLYNGGQLLGLLGLIVIPLGCDGQGYSGVAFHGLVSGK